MTTEQKKPDATSDEKPPRVRPAGESARIAVMRADNLLLAASEQLMDSIGTNRIHESDIATSLIQAKAAVAAQESILQSTADGVA